MGHPERAPQNIPERRSENCHEKIDIFANMHHCFKEMPVYARNPHTAMDCLPPIALEPFTSCDSKFVSRIGAQMWPGRGLVGSLNEIGAMVTTFRDGMASEPMAGFEMPVMPIQLGHREHGWNHRPHHGSPAEIFDLSCLGSRIMSPAVLDLGQHMIRRPAYGVGANCYNVGFRQPREECHERFRWSLGYNHNAYRPSHREYHPAIPKTPGGHSTPTHPTGPGGLAG